MAQETVSPINIDELAEKHAQFFDIYVQPEAASYLFEHATDLQTDIGAVSVQNFLHDQYVDGLNALMATASEGGGRIIHDPLIPDLVEALTDMSRLYVEHNKLLSLHATIKDLHYAPGIPGVNTLVPPHHDWKDGNAVLYNWDVEGPQQVYRLGKSAVRIASNQLVILNGDSTYLPSRDAYGTVVHAVEPAEGVPESEFTHMARKRILLFWDGEPTDVTMLPPEA